ncbi:right-handed parallel beta-helix repeat-containing protein [Shewanella youngdeokensis]|uniref:Right handed beta helix domain-containing protein n=1 Tax=Shewanella youngdeokensis TaxID=2999068 RepID=A0ABZ0K1Z6_9GAMM|nr:hypothetical protein RGE70_02775 [Shewanella sp. DAU334]
MNSYYLLPVFLTPLMCGCGSDSDNSTPTPNPDDSVPMLPITPADPIIKECAFQDTSAGYLVSSVSELESVLHTTANNGEDDIIYIAAGTYSVTEPLTYDFSTLNGEAMEKLSLYGCGADQTIFDGGDITRVFNFYKNGPEIDAVSVHVGPHPQLHIQDLTIQNGNSLISGSDKYGNSGAALHVQRYETDLVRVHLLNNLDIYEGSAMNGSGHTTLTEVVVTNNSGGTAISVCGQLTVTDSVISDNDGGGVYRGICLDGNYAEYDVDIVRSNFDSNGTLGALYVLGSTTPGRMTITDSVFSHNSSRSYGAAVGTRHGNLTIKGSQFIANEVIDDQMQCTDYTMDCQSGAALFVDNWYPGGGLINIENTIFKDNVATDNGAAIDLGFYDCESDIIRGYSDYCVPTDYSTALQNAITLTIADSIFSGNRSANGANLSVSKTRLSSGFQSANVSISHSTFTEDTGASSVIVRGDLVLTASHIENTAIVNGELTQDNTSSIGELVQP